MTSYITYRSFLLSLGLLMILYTTPILSSSSEDGMEGDLEAGIHVVHNHANGVPCVEKPETPYTMQNLPPTLKDDLRFTYLKNWGYRYWVLGNVLSTVKYVAGVTVVGTTNAALWSFVNEDAKEGLNIAAAVLTGSIALLQGFEAGANNKAKRYKKEAKAMIALENLRAGIPLQNLVPPLVEAEENL